MSYRRNNPYLSSSGKHDKLKKLEKRESLTFLEKVGIFLPNSSEIDVNELRSRMSPTTHNTLDNYYPKITERNDASPNRISLKPLKSKNTKSLDGLTFESSIRSRVDSAKESLLVKERSQASQIWKDMQKKHNSKPLVTFSDKLKVTRQFPKKTKAESKIDGMKSVFWSPSFSTKHIIPGTVARDRSNKDWINTYGKETDYFASRSKWASVKLLEVSEMSNAARGPSRMLVTIVTQLLLELEDRIHESMPCAKIAIDHILYSIFKDNHEIAKVRNVRDNSAKRLINHIMKAISYFEEVGRLRDQIHHERNLLPGFQKYLDMLKKQQAAEKRSLELTVKRWQNSMLTRIFTRWKDSIATQKRASRMLGIYFFKRKQIGLKTLWKEWKIIVSRSRYDRERNWEDHALAQVKEYSGELRELREKTMNVMMDIDNVSSVALDYETKLAAAMEILHDPARQPPTVRKIIVSLASALKIGGDIAILQQSKNTTDYFRRDPDAFRLSTMHITHPATKEFQDPDFLKEVRAEEDIERTLLSWRPGQFNSIEKTPAFQPFETRDGMLLLQWVNFHLGREPAKKILKNKLLEVPDDLTDCSIYLALNRFTLLPAIEDRKQIEMDNQVVADHTRHTRNNDADDASDDGEEKPRFDLKSEKKKFKTAMEAKLYERADNMLNELKQPDLVALNKKVSFHDFQNVELPLGRFITAEDITGIPREPTEEEKAKHEARMARLAAREAESGIIVHIMSRYCGQRIHVEGREIPLKFALIVATLSKSDGFMYIPEEMEHREFMMLEEATTKWNEFRATCVKLATKGQLAFLHEDLTAMNDVLQHQQVRINKILKWRSDQYIASLPDREKWACFRDRLTYLMWQSVCTTVLSRKVKIEEDIDDGSFTTIERQQLVNSVFKRAKIMEEEEQEEIIKSWQEMFKHRIRDLKRIFQYYAAAEAGDANSMDHAEWWKFVRECKFQKDRKAMPSVRVDLIFQACNIDYTLDAKDRAEADDGEMESTEWTESLVRTSSWRYSKKTGGALDKRLERLMNEDMLPNACSVDCDVFRERLAGDEVQAVYHKHRRNLKKIYLVYAADDDDGDAALAMDTMNCKELVSFCMEMKLTGPILSQRAVRTIFAFVQQEEAELDEDEDDDDGSEMVYSEFIEALAAIAMFLRPNPYEVVPSRINRYIKEILLPAAKDNEKTRKVVK